MSGSRPTAALLVVLLLLATAAAPLALAAPRAARGGPAPSAAICPTVLTITQAPPSPTAQTTATVKVEYGEVITTNPNCLSVGGGELFTFTVNGVDRTSYFTYGYNATTGLNEAYGTNVPLEIGVTNSLVAETQGGTPAMPDGSMGTVADTAQVLVTASVAVTPDNRPADARPLRQNVQSFTVINGPTAASFNLTATCTGTATSCAPSAWSLSLAAGASSIVTVAYQAGATGATGTVTLLAAWQAAPAVRDSGWASVTVRSEVVKLHTVNPETSIERDLCLTIAMGSGAASECGDLRLTYALPTTRTKNKVRTPTLLYSSQHAHPYPLIAANVTLPDTIAPPDSVTAKVFFGTTMKASGTWAGSDFVLGSARRIVLGFEALTLPTGLYPYALEVKSWRGGAAPFTETVASDLVIVNRSYLGSGAGWWIAGVEYLYFPDSSKVLWVGGDGSTRLYQPAPSTTVNGATRCNWAAPTLDRPDTLSSNCAGVYTRHAPHGVKVEFDANGRHVRTINRLGDVTTFTWHPTLQRVDTIRIPPSTANLAYVFHYNPTSGLIDSVVAPPIGTQRRVITVSTDLGMAFNPGWGTMSGGRITAFRGTDTSRVQYTYVSTSYRATSRTDRRGTVRTFTYDAGQRLTRDSLAMGTGATDIVTAFQPQETQGLPGAGRPGAADTALVSTLLDGPRSDAGDTTRFWLNRWGAPTKIRDALGYETQVARSDAQWPALVTRLTRPNSYADSATYDAGGHLATAVALNPLGTAENAPTRYHWTALDMVDSVVSPSGITMTLGYAPNGNRLWQQIGSDSARRARFFYGGPCGLLSSTQIPGQSARDSLEYDAARCNPSVARTALGFRTSVVTDVIGRGILDSTQVDVAGTQYVVHRPGYDLAGRVVADTTIAGGDTILVRTHYDAEGNADTVATRSGPDRNGIGWVTRAFTVDRAHRKTAERLAGSLVAAWSYDAAGNDTLSAPTGRLATATTYDRLNRPVRRVGTTTDTLAYDLMGRLTLANNPYAQITRTYYPNGALETDTLRIATSDTTASTRWTAHVYGLRHRYDLEGRRIALRYPATLIPAGMRDSVVSGYDAVTGDLRSVRDLRDSAFTFGYDNAGRLASQGSPGLSETFAYDADSRLLRRVRFNGAPNWRDSLLYDARGKVVANTGASDSFGYLAIGPVINSSLGSVETLATYTVDALGNRRTARVADNQGNFGTDSSRYEAGTGRLVATWRKHMGVVRPDSTLSWFNWDGSLSGTDAHRVLGCTSSPCVLQSTWILEVRVTANRYDAAGHLVASTFQFDTIPWLSPKPYATYRRTSAYRYDALGRRVWQRVVRGANCYQKEEYTGCRSTVTRTVWDGDQVLFEVRTSGDSGGAGGAWTSESDGASGSGAGDAGYGRVGYVHAGGIDAPLELFKESDVVVPHANWRGVYDSGTCPTSACASTVQFPGGRGTAGVFGDGYNPDVVDWYGSLVWAQQDASGYQYKRNRYYDPTSGRFTQEDPIGLAGGLNLYGYANGDPVNFSDPFGLCSPMPLCLVGQSIRNLMDAVGLRGVPLTAPEGRNTLYATANVRIGPLRTTVSTGAKSGVSQSICLTCTTPVSLGAGAGSRFREAEVGENMLTVNGGPVTASNESVELGVGTLDGCPFLCLDVELVPVDLPATPFDTLFKPDVTRVAPPPPPPPPPKIGPRP